MANVIEINIDKLIPDNKNFNKGTEYGQHLIEESIRKFGAGRSILVDKNDRVIAGNKTLENYSNVGLEKVIVVETDGNTLVAVKRKDIDLDSQKGREMALADNATGKANLAWDNDMIMRAAEEHGMDAASWGVNIEEVQPNYQSIGNATPKDDDDFEAKFNAITDANCEMPIVPDFFESHECFIIPVHNSIDEGFVRDLFGLNQIYGSASGDGKKRRTNVISVEKLRMLIQK